MKDFKELEVWQKSVNLAIDIYELIKRLPNEEKYTLADQIRRCAISISSNIAEGFSRQTTKDSFISFIYL